MNAAPQMRRKRNPGIPPVTWVEDPRRYTVSVAEVAWTKHILPKHENMAGKFRELLDAIRIPDFITQSPFSPALNLYYRRAGGMLIRAVVQMQYDAASGDLITAYPSRGPAAGERVIYGDIEP